MSEYICVFDCETLPDAKALVRALPEDLVQDATDKDGNIDEKALSLLAWAISQSSRHLGCAG